MSADDEPGKKKKKKSQAQRQSKISLALNSKEYSQLLDFFIKEVPAIILKISSITQKSLNN